MCLMPLRQMLARAVDPHLIAANLATRLQKLHVCNCGTQTWTDEQAHRFRAVAGRSI
jgi:hypothetical protein